MLTLIQSESNEWMVIAAGGELRIYTREQPGVWSELSLSESAEEVEAEKGFMLEELYLRQDGQEEDDEEDDDLEPEEAEGDEAEAEGEEDAEVPEEDEDEEEEPTPSRPRQGGRGRRGRAAAKER